MQIVDCYERMSSWMKDWNLQKSSKQGALLTNII
jgi:hypothetical protein